MSHQPHNDEMEHLPALIAGRVGAMKAVAPTASVAVRSLNMILDVRQGGSLKSEKEKKDT
jgi:hypothetical protein